MPGPSPRFFWMLLLLAGAACAGYAFLVLAGTSLATVQALDGIAATHEHWHIRTVTLAELTTLRLTLGAVALALGLPGLWLAASGAGRQQLRQLAWEVKSVWTGSLTAFARLPGRARWLALALALVLTALRTYFSLTKPIHPEEIASYEYFVSKGLLAVSAYYPIPNNHILSSALDWVFYRIHPGFWWSMRLPVLLVSSGGTWLLFMGLLRRSGFRMALWGTAGFCWLQLSLFNASAGRGYWLLITLAGMLFFATLALSHTVPRHPRAAWALLLLAGLAGGYTVPTFAYALASAWSWLLWQSLRRRDGALARRLGGVAATTALGYAALYAPVILVSGARLFGNGFVSARKAAVFWPGFPGYWWYTEGMLAGQRSIGAVAGLAVVAVVGSILWRGNGQTQESNSPIISQKAQRHLLMAAALWFVLFPYVLLLVQRVFTPERVLLYKSFFLFILVAMLASKWRRSQAVPRRAWAGGLLFGVFLVFAAYQTYYVENLNRAGRVGVAAYRAGFDWLSHQPPGAVLTPEPLHEIYFRFYAHTVVPGRLWQMDMVAKPTQHYAYVVAFPNQRGAFQPRFSFPPAFANSEMEIYVVPRP